MFLLTVIKTYHRYVLFSEFSVSQIYFELASISKNWSSNFSRFYCTLRGFCLILSILKNWSSNFSRFYCTVTGFCLILSISKNLEFKYFEVLLYLDRILFDK